MPTAHRPSLATVSLLPIGGGMVTGVTVVMVAMLGVLTSVEEPVITV